MMRAAFLAGLFRAALLWAAAALGAVCPFAAAAAEDAADNSGKLNVSVELADGCFLGFDSANIDFGIINKNNHGSLQRTGSFRVHCGGSVWHKGIGVALNFGANSAGGSWGSKKRRRLVYNPESGSPAFINYEVYQGKVAGGPVWGDDWGSLGVGLGRTVYKIKGGDGNQPYYFTVFIPPSEDLRSKPDGIYHDVLIATVAYIEWWD